MGLFYNSSLVLLPSSSHTLSFINTADILNGVERRARFNRAKGDQHSVRTQERQRAAL